MSAPSRARSMISALILDVPRRPGPGDPDSQSFGIAELQRRAGRAARPAPPSYAFRAHADLGQGRYRGARRFEELAQNWARARSICPPAICGAWEAQRVDHGRRDGAQSRPLADKGGEAISRAIRDLIAEGRAVTAPQYLAAMTRCTPLRRQSGRYLRPTGRHRDHAVGAAAWRRSASMRPAVRCSARSGR